MRQTTTATTTAATSTSSTKTATTTIIATWTIYAGKILVLGIASSAGTQQRDKEVTTRGSAAGNSEQVEVVVSGTVGMQQRLRADVEGRIGRRQHAYRGSGRCALSGETTGSARLQREAGVEQRLDRYRLDRFDHIDQEPAVICRHDKVTMNAQQLQLVGIGRRHISK